jgi:23S rRNA (uracil1939-C5)-methyltransferase
MPPRRDEGERQRGPEDSTGAHSPQREIARRRASELLATIDEVELTIEKLVQGGDGLGRVDGIPILVPRTAPGDRARVVIVERKPDYGRGEVQELLRPGPGRRTPPCPFFERCGGCDLQHLEDDLQAQLKTAAAREALERIGGIVLPRDVEIVRGQDWGYRLRTQLQVGADEAGARAVGYFERGSHRLVAVDRCPILRPELERELEGLPALLAAEGRTIRRLDLAVGDDRVTAAPPLTGLPQGEAQVQVGAYRYAFDARCFFQSHRGLLERLVELAVGGFSGDAAFDLYAGVGLFSLPLAARYRTVLAVESDRIAARYARHNAQSNRALNLTISNQTVERWIGELPSSCDRVLVDPPREGLGRRVRALLLERPPERLTYVSCQPATLARDLAVLAGSHRVESVVFVDLFPQTAHLETVVQLIRRD